MSDNYDLNKLRWWYIQSYIDNDMDREYHFQNRTPLSRDVQDV